MTELYHFVQPSLFGLPKECTSCHIEKPLDEFYKQSPARGGYQTWCKVCWNEKRRLKRLQALQNPPEYEPITSQICKQCDIEKSIDNFYAVPGSKTGYRATCKDCIDRGDKRKKKVGQRRKVWNTPITPGYKWCYSCDSEKPLGEFYTDGAKRDGLAHQCKSCSAEQNRIHRRKNRDWLLPVEREYHRARYEANIERERARNREKNKKPQARLRMNELLRRRNAHIKNVANGEVSYVRVLERDGYHCYICERDISPTATGQGKLTFDHRIPLIPRPGEPKGTHSEENLHPAHYICNLRKGNRPFEGMTPHQRRGPDV